MHLAWWTKLKRQCWDRSGRTNQPLRNSAAAKEIRAALEAREQSGVAEGKVMAKLVERIRCLKEQKGG